MVPGQVRTRRHRGHGGGRDSSQPCTPHGRPPSNPFTKQEPLGRKGGEAGGGEDGGRKGGGVSGEGAAGPVAGKPRDAAALSPPPGAGYGARTARGAGWGLRGTPGARRARVLCADPARSAPPKRPAGPGLTVPPVARARVLSRPAAAPCPSSRSSLSPYLAPGCTAAAARPTDERRPRRTAFKYRARPRRERRPPPALGPAKLGRVGGLP